MANNTSQHILSTSANLLGFCLFVITSLHVTNQVETKQIDEVTAAVAIFAYMLLYFFIYFNQNVKI